MAEVKKYMVPLTGVANIAVEVETEETDPEKIVELAQEQVSASVCYQCANRDSLNLGDEWDPVMWEGVPEVNETR
jgi:hypothetical protein